MDMRQDEYREPISFEEAALEAQAERNAFVFGPDQPDADERCPHAYHVTEGHCPTCDLDRDGKCGPHCNHDHG